MGKINDNTFYHRAKEKGLVRDEKVCLMHEHQASPPKIGVCVRVMLTYNLTTYAPSCYKQYAYGAIILFNNLSMAEYNRIVDSSTNLYGLSDKAPEFAVMQLLSRNDIVFATKNETILKHPLMAMKVGNIKGSIYGGGGVNGATPEAIAYLQNEVSGLFSFEDELDAPVNPAWLEMDKKKNREHYSEMAM